ncbi:MAG: DUF2905 domain-containing protein [Ignavibacteriales bacterium]|nr:DUF2905 domain-containing protein [Ignavibacteriales bacterium]
MNEVGKLFIVFGIAIVGIGILLTFFDKIPLLGKLPGDISVKKDNFQFYFPLTTSIVLSVVLSLIFWMISNFSKR